ncbi:MAG: IS1380 family transposase [Solirubrobacterales bacterium]|nr:IS1380 family transposase [Solirubrobacterales bacterium]
MKAKTLGAKVEVTADGEGLVSHTGACLLSELADRIGLTKALSEAMAPTRERPSAHDPGRVVRDLAVMLADGGDCLADLGALREQVDLLGAVASDSTAWRVIDSIDAERLESIRAARASARRRAWAQGARPAEIVLDIDATLLTSHSDKEGAAPTYKRGFGFHPMLCYLGGEPLAGVLRPGNAGANTAADHIGVLVDALDQLPEAVREDEDARVLVRTDSAGCTHAFLDAVIEMECSFSASMPIDEHAQKVILAVAESAWTPAIRQDGAEREGAWVAELSDLDLSGWPEGSRAICRKERPHPGAQLTFSDAGGHRFQVLLTNQAGDSVALEARHRARARVEDAIRAAKDTGLRNLPFREFTANAAWLELVLVAQDLMSWAQSLLLEGDLARAEPKRLRYRLLHVAGRITRSGRRIRLHLPARWPWAEALVEAFARLRALPAPG